MSPRSLYSGIFLSAIGNGSFYISTDFSMTSRKKFSYISESLSLLEVKD